jgi:hypothetical protein
MCIKITRMNCIAPPTTKKCARNFCVIITLSLVVYCSVYAIISLWALHATVMETQLTLHTALTMAQQRHKTDQSVCYTNNSTSYHDICDMVDVATGILDRFPGNKVAYKLVNFMSFLYGFTIIVQ